MTDVFTTRQQRPLEIGGVLGSTFELIGNQTALVMGMAFLFSLITRVTQPAVERSGINFDNISSYIWIITPLVPLGFGVMLLSMIGMGALAGVALAQSERREANFWPFFRRGLERLPTVVAVLLLSGVGISLGFMCLIIPGIVLMLMWSMVGPVAVLEDKGIIGTFSRSKELTTNVLWRIFLVLMIVNIGTSIFSWVVTALVGPFFSGPDNRLVLGSGPEAFLLLTITDTLAMAVTLAANAVLYVRLVERHGGPTTQRLGEIFE